MMISVAKRLAPGILGSPSPGEPRPNRRERLRIHYYYDDYPAFAPCQGGQHLLQVGT